MKGVEVTRNESKANGKELRMAHFDLGHDKPTYMESEKAMKEKSPKKEISKFVQFSR